MAGSEVGSRTRCGSCGNDLRVRSRFCDVCGSPVDPVSAPGEHKQVTVLFADVVGSMQLAARIDPERLREIMNDLLNRSATVVQRYQGTIDKFTGDGLMALFGAPVALEDHALRACIAALEIQSVVGQLAAEVQRKDGVCLQLRVGLNSGDVIVGEIGSGPNSYTAIGHAVGMAQRMEAAAPAGAVLCSIATADLVEHAARLGPVQMTQIKGAAEPVPARRLLGVEPTRMVVGRNEGRMLGRERELGALCDALDGRNQIPLVTVVGAPGVGKSRLVEEFCSTATNAGAEVVLAACDSRAKPIAFRALVRLLRTMFGVEGLGDDDARARVLSLVPMSSTDAQIAFETMGFADGVAEPLHVGADGRRHRLVAMMTRFVSARSTPLVIIVEDVHWIDAASEAVLIDFISAMAGAPALLVATHRPEYRGALRQRSARTVTLAPLDDSLTEAVALNLLGCDETLTGLPSRIAAVAAGNPYFVEEIVRDLAGRGVLAGGRGDYRLVGDADDIPVPATVHAVLAARIDRLEPATKAVLNSAAVIGHRFDVDVLEVLAPTASSGPLAELVATELIDQTEFAPRQRFCFRHPLVRTVAYDSQISSRRRQAHRLLAATLQDRGQQDENAALIATHLAAAGDDEAACRWHLRAADWLRVRDLPAAREQWSIALRLADRLPGSGADVAALRIAPRSMLLSTELFVGADPDNGRRLEELRALTARGNDPVALALALAGRVMALIVNANRVWEAMPLAEELTALVDSLDDRPAAELEILFTAMAFVQWAHGRFEATLQIIGRSLHLVLDAPSVDRAVAYAITGLCETCLGDTERGVDHIRMATDLARAMPPVSFSAIGIYWGMLAGMGLYTAEELVDEMRDALARAESFGDRFGIIAAQWTYGTLLLKSGRGRREEAIDLLKRAEEGIGKHRLQAFALSITGTQLAVEDARDGHRDEAIEALRRLVWSHTAEASPVLMGCPAEALCELLIDRDAPADRREVAEVLAEWRRRSPGTAPMDRWTVRMRALLTGAQDSRAD